MKLAICDDNEKERLEVAQIIKRHRPAWRCECFESGEALLDSYENGAMYDLVFLDIYMKLLNGLETAKALRRHDTHAALVFLTTSRDFAVESYQVQALSYLLKPIGEDALLDTLSRFETAFHPKSILIGERLFVARDIAYLESQDKKVVLHFKDKSRAELTAKLDEVERKLFACFLRCHRSFAVNMDAVSRVDGREFVLSTGERVPMRRQDAAELTARYFAYVTSL